MANTDSYDELDPYAAPKADLTRPVAGRSATRGIDLATENPFLTIWTRPRATIRGILDQNPTYLVIPLAMAGGVVQALDRATQRNAGDALPLGAILGMALVAGSIGGLIGLYIGGALTGWAGRLLGGRGTGEEVRAALAWAEVPVLATIPIWIIQLALIGKEMFTSETPNLEANPALGLVLMATGVIEIVLGIWALVIMFKCVGEAHGFSAWKALGSMLLLVLIIAVPLFVIALLFFMAAR